MCFGDPCTGKDYKSWIGIKKFLQKLNWREKFEEFGLRLKVCEYWMA